MQITRQSREETTPPISPASVPSVMVRTRHTRNERKSAQDVRQSGFSSANWANRENKFTITMAASEALGM